MKPRYALIALVFLLFAFDEVSAGVLYARRPGTEAPLYNLKISKIRTHITIEGLLAVTHVDEEFYNGNNMTLEGFYAFQLPEGAQVDGLWLWVDGRRLTFIVKKKEDAERMYDSVVVGQRRDPAILEDLGSNRFQLKVFPISPYSSRRVEMQYFTTLPWTEDGYVHYSYPLNMKGYQSDPVDITEMSISVKSHSRILDLATGFDSNPLLNRVQRIDEYNYAIQFGLEKQNYTQDYTLRYKPEGLFDSFPVLSWHDPDTTGTNPYFMVWHTLIDQSSTTTPRDLVFVLDASGSMDGQRISAVKTATKDIIAKLNPNDRFKIVLFSTEALSDPPGDSLYDATSANIASAGAFIDRYYEASALTNYEAALSAALSVSFRPGADKRMLFLTDGEPTVGKATSAQLVELISSLDPNGAVRIYPVAFYATQLKLLDDIANARGGQVTNVESTDNLETIIGRLLLDLDITGFSGTKVDYLLGGAYMVYPESFPAIIASSRFITTGRSAASCDSVRVQWNTRTGESVSTSRLVDFESGSTTLKEVGAYWGAMRIEELLEQVKIYGLLPELKNSIINLSIKHQVLTPYTAFLVLENNPEDPPSDVESSIVGSAGFNISPVYPNPFRSSSGSVVTIPFVMNQTAPVRIVIVDILGRTVRVLADDQRPAGRYDITWDGHDETGRAVAPGLYFVRMTVAGVTNVVRISILR
jgi:Ca-activated chloride channel family protein